MPTVENSISTGNSNRAIPCERFQSSAMIDDKAALVGVLGEGAQGLRFGGCHDDAAEFVVTRRAADSDGFLDLKPEDTPRTAIVEFDDKVVHRIALAILLNGNAGDIAGQTGGTLVAQEMREIIGDDRIFVCKASTAGQFGGSWFLFKCVGQGGPPGSIC